MLDLAYLGSRMKEILGLSTEPFALCPLKDAPAAPDVVVVEGPPESLMWLALADLNLEGGMRLRADTAVLQATCEKRFSSNKWGWTPRYRAR